MNIPSLDLNLFLHGTHEEKDMFVQQLGSAYADIGFAAVKNHFLDEKISSDLYQFTKQFFDLEHDIKRKYQIEGLAGQRGYTSFGKEHAKNSTKGDLKEFYHFGQEIEDEDPTLFGYPINIKVDEIPQFYIAAMDAFRALEKTGKYMLRAMALYLGLEEDYFDQKIKNGNSILRPIHYAPILSDPDSAVRAGAHEDINLITLLMGASSEGLEILDKQGNWVAVTALPDHVVVNVGDMLERLTNNVFKSTTHRVVNPPKDKWSEPRYSIPFFLHPRSEVRLDCLEQCISDNKPIAYTPISAGEFLEERLREIGLLK